MPRIEELAIRFSGAEIRWSSLHAMWCGQEPRTVQKLMMSRERDVSAVVELDATEEAFTEAVSQ